MGEPEFQMLVDFVEATRWYDVDEVGKIFGFSRDTVIRLVKRRLLEALVLPPQSSRKRTYSCRRVQGAEIIRFAKQYTRVGS